MSPQVAIRAALDEAGAALQRGDPRAAETVLLAADRDAPASLEIKLQLALALRLSGRPQAALAALDEALAIDPYCFVALLSKGAILEREGLARAAAQIYRDALAVAPSEIPPSLTAPVARAKAAIARDVEAMDAFLRASLAGAPAMASSEASRRFEEGLGILSGRLKPQPAQPLLLHYPRLPAIPFLDRSHFAWLPRLEAATDMIREELLALRRVRLEAFAPYIDLPPGAPVNQWGELNHSEQWTSFWLWKNGEVQAEAQALCPRTTALLADLPLADQPGFAPTAVFSALQAGAHIPPHTGSTNVRALVHLPLVLPGPARFRVGNETRKWRLGEAWVFDDTIEHEAWNDADETRVILILDVWNPLLTAQERERISTIMAARKAYYAGETPTPRAGG